MNISNLSASVVLEETFLDDYKIGMDHFYSELAELNTIIYLSEKIANFPFDLFLS
jgi:hypothetical protein